MILTLRTEFFHVAPDTSAGVHHATRWQVGSVDFQTLIYDSGWDTVNLTETTISVSARRVIYVRVATQDDLLQASPWSEPLALAISGVPLDDASGYRGRVFGRSGGPTIYLAGIETDDDGTLYYMRLRPDPVAPAGAAGEAEFHELHIPVWHLGAVDFTVAPMVNGRKLPTVLKHLDAIPGATEPERTILEIPLREAYASGGVNRSRQGIRGTWFSFELVAAVSDRHFGVEQAGLVWEEVEDSHPQITYSPEETVDAPLAQPVRRFFGGARLLRAGEGADDAALPFTLVAEINEVAPAGPDGECVFWKLSLLVYRENAAPITLRVTPRASGVAGNVVDLVLPPTAAHVWEVHEVPLVVSYMVGGVAKSVQGMRGARFSCRVESVGALPAGTLGLEEATLEHEIVTKSRKAG